MPKPQLGSSDLAKIDQIQDNLIAYYRLFTDLPGITFSESDVSLFLNRTGGGPGNTLLRTRITGDTVDRRIDEILDQVGLHADHLDWLVFPSCRPADLGERLTGQGMKGGSGGTWMLATLQSQPDTLSTPAEIHIERVIDDGMLEAWARVSGAGFGTDSEISYDAYVRHGFGPDASSQRFVGYLGDELVTSGTLLLAGGIAGIYDVSTPPTLRGRGFGSAITWGLMEEARNRGYHHAWLLSSAMGRGVYSELGFVAADFGVREYPWKRR